MKNLVIVESLAKTKNETATQYNCSDWDFVNIKAESNALLVFTDDDKIMIKKPKVENAKFEINYSDRKSVV